MKGQIEKRGDSVYRLRWYRGRIGERRVYGSKTVRGTKRDAERVLREILARGDRGFAAPSPSSVPRLADYIDVWKEGQAASTLRDRTRRDYLALLKRHVTPTLGMLRLNEVHTAQIEAEVVSPLRKAGHLRTARLAVSALSRVYRAALKDPAFGLIGNPCHGVEVGRKPRRPIEPLTAAERARFREAIRGTSQEALWLLMMLTGLGPGEALGLGWEHVDLRAGELRVVRTLDCKARRLVEDTKRPSRLRTVPLVPELVAALRDRWRAAGHPIGGLLFADANGEPLDLDNLRARHFVPALEAAKITRRVRIYDLRHGFATAALEAGADNKTVADLMGHSSTRTTENVYQHVSSERKREAAARIEGVLMRSS